MAAKALIVNPVPAFRGKQGQNPVLQIGGGQPFRIHVEYPPGVDWDRSQQLVERTPRFTAGSQVKVSRSAVAMTRILTSLAVRSDRMLMRLFERAARGLPLAAPSAVQRPARAAMFAAHTPGPTAEYSRPRSQLESSGRRSDGSSAL